MLGLLLRFMDSFMIHTEAFGLTAGGANGATTFLSRDLGKEITAFHYGPAAARVVVYSAMTRLIAYGDWRAMTAERVAHGDMG